MTYTEIASISTAIVIAIVFIFFLNVRNKPKKEKKTNPSVVKALSLFFNGDSDKAIVELKNMVYLGNASPEIYLILGFLQRKKGDYTYASQIHEMMLGNTELGNDFRNALISELAKDYMLAGQYAKAVTLLKKESHLINIPENLVTLARSNLAVQNYDNAINYHVKYHKITGKSLPGFFEKCMVEKAVNSSSFANAKKYIKSALEANKFCRPARIIKGLIYLKENKPLKAVDEYNKVLQDGLLRDMNDYKTIEKAYIATGKEHELIDILRELTSKGLINPFIHIALADYYEYNNDRETSKNILESYIELPESKIIAAKIYAERFNNKMIAHATNNSYNYKCNCCSYETNEYKDDCPKCNAYDSIYLK